MTLLQRRSLLQSLWALPLAGCGGGGGRDELVVPTSAPADDWPTASPQSQGVSAGALQALLDTAKSHECLRSLLVVRNGQLIGERYYGGTLSSDLLHIRSSTKTVSSLLIGQAIRDGRIADLTVPLRDLLARELSRQPGAAAADIPLRRILQMRGGLAWNDGRYDLDEVPDLTQLALGLRATGTTQWNYDSASSHLPSAILAGLYGMDELGVAAKLLFEPLGIRQAAWSRDATGTNHGSFGLQLRARDFMKIAWMALDGGQWQGRSVVPAAWLTESHRSHVELGGQGAMRDIGYGYLWWTGTLGQQPVVYSWGHGGQFAMLFPALRMCIVTNARWRISFEEGDAQHREIFGLLDPFIRQALEGG